MRLLSILIASSLLATMTVPERKRSVAGHPSEAAVVINGATIIDVRSGKEIKDSVVVLSGDRLSA